MVNPIDEFLQNRRNDVSLTPPAQASLPDWMAKWSAAQSQPRHAPVQRSDKDFFGRLGFDMNVEPALANIEDVRSDYLSGSHNFSTITDRELTGFGNFLEKMNTTPEDWEEFTQVEPVAAELMWVQDQLSRLGANKLLPGNTQEESLAHGKFRLQNLLRQDSQGNSLAEIQTRGAYNPMVGVDMAATVAFSPFLAHELAGSLVLGRAGLLVGQAISGEQGGRTGENIGSFLGQFVAGAPRNPARLFDGVEVAMNARKAKGIASIGRGGGILTPKGRGSGIVTPRMNRGLSATTGVDYYVEEAKDMLAIAKGTYKIAGVSYNAVNGITKSTTEIAKVLGGGVATRTRAVKKVVLGAANEWSPVGTAEAMFDVSGEGLYPEGFNIFEMAKDYDGPIPRNDLRETSGGWSDLTPQGDERYIDDIIEEAGNSDLADQKVSQKGVPGFVPKHNANLNLAHTRTFDIFPEGQSPKIVGDGEDRYLDFDGVENYVKIRVDKVEGRRADGTPLFLRKLYGENLEGAYVIGARLAHQRQGQQGSNVYRVSVQDSKGTGDAPLTRDNIFELADQMFEHLEDADAIEMLRSRTRDRETVAARGPGVESQKITRQDVENYRFRKNVEIAKEVSELDDAELIRRTRLTRFKISNDVWRSVLENVYLEKQMKARNLTTNTATTKQTDKSLIDEYVKLLDDLDGGNIDFDSAQETRLSDLRREGVIRNLEADMNFAAQNSPRERALNQMDDVANRADAEPEWDESAVVDREARIGFEDQWETPNFSGFSRGYLPLDTDSPELIEQAMLVARAGRTEDAHAEIIRLYSIAEDFKLDGQLDEATRLSHLADEMDKFLSSRVQLTLEERVLQSMVDDKVLTKDQALNLSESKRKEIVAKAIDDYSTADDVEFNRLRANMSPEDKELSKRFESDPEVIPPESPEELLRTYVNAIENAPLTNEADRFDYSNELSILKQRLQDHFTLEEIDDAVAAGSGNLPADKLGFRTAENTIETTAKPVPETMEDVARDYPDVPPSEIDNASDDLHVTEAAARLPVLDGEGEPPPKMPGDPVGSSPAGDSGPPAQSTWVALKDALDIPSWEDYSLTFARWWEGARNTESIRMMRNFDNLEQFAENPTWYMDRARALSPNDAPGKYTAMDVIDGVEGAFRKEKAPKSNRTKLKWNRETALPIFRALHVSKDHKHWQDLTPDQWFLADEINKWKIAEENDMFKFLSDAAAEDAELWRYDMENFASQMMANPNYFPRGWKRVNQKFGKTLADLSPDERLAVEEQFADFTPQELEAMRAAQTVGGASGSSFKRRRNKYTFDEMISFDFEPKSWNPIAMMAERRLAGNEYREMINLVNRLKQVRKIHNNVQGEHPGTGYKQPNHPIFQARRKIVDADNPNNNLPAREGLVVEDWMANWIDKNFGVSTPMSRSGLKKWSNRTKSVKLVASGFQHADIMGRTAFMALAPMENWRQARNGEFPPATKLFPLMWEILNVVVRPGARRSMKKNILSSNKEIGNTGITLQDVLEQGWETRGDLSVRNELSEWTSTQILPETSGFKDVAGTPFRAIQKINEFWQSGLFEGLYTATQKWALENFIVPSIKAQHPDWSNKVVAAQAAETVNIMFSSLGSWQTAMKNMPPGWQDATHAMIFSTNETESLLRGAMRAALPRIVSKDTIVTGLERGRGALSTTPGGKARRGVSIPGTNSKLVMSEHFKQFADMYAGAFIFLAVTANLVNWTATGKPLPLSSLTPTKRDDPYAPFGIGYKSDFMSPQVPFIKGRNGTPIYADLVGQMDTAFRWALDPVAATAARLNVIPRAIGNQLAGENFMGQPAETFGERLTMAATDLGVPISGMNALGAIREKVPGLRSNLLPNESRLGVAGQFAQAFSGFNLRSEQTNELKDRMGIARAEDDLSAEEVSERDSIPTMGRAISSLVGPPRKNTATRNFTAPQLAMAKIDLAVERGNISEEERSGLFELLMREVNGAIRESGTSARGKGWYGIGENDVLIAWGLFKDDPRVRKALMNKAKVGGFERKLGPQ